jgi:hypothetical protein
MCQPAPYREPLDAELESFATEEEAMAAMSDRVDDPFEDNHRFAFCDDAAAVAEFDRLESEGCCGSYFSFVLVAGRRAVIGCNYGH